MMHICNAVVTKLFMDPIFSKFYGKIRMHNMKKNIFVKVAWEIFVLTIFECLGLIT